MAGDALAAPLPATTQSCANCHLFRDQGTWDDARHFVCRRFPQFVNREPRDWCGEWQEKVEPEQISTR
jgi:hypothetical protein